jgi:membrane protein YdbS with pleckstrin-like domain
MGMSIWKDIFWACALLFVAYLLVSPFSAAGGPWDIARLIAIGLSLIPIYGYAYRVAIGSQAIAILIFGCNAIFVALASLLALYALITNGSLLILFLVVVFLALSFAYLYPQYRYAFDSEDLWVANA